MLVTFIVMSVGVYGFSAKWLAHELDHAHQSHEGLADHDLTPYFDAQGSPNSEPLSDAEHRLLHAYSHAEQFVGSVFSVPGASPAQAALVRTELRSLLPQVLESPFRPPRNTSLL